MDEMGKEVWHEELQLTVSAQHYLHEGQSEDGMRTKIARLLKLEQTWC